MRMADVTKNPPLDAYYIAAVAGGLGFGEVPLHLAFLIPALGVVFFTYRLGQRLAGRPLLAALVVLTTPVFLVSSTSVMCDVWMLALWLASVWLWITGLDAGSRSRLLLAASVAALAALTKYFALALVPLLLAYTWRRKGGPAPAWPLAIPVVIAAAYHAATAALYGRGLVLDAAAYSTGARPLLGSPAGPLIGLAFTGGCVGVSLLLPLLAGRRGIAAVWIGLAGAIALLVMFTGGVGAWDRADLAVHFGIFMAMGIGVLGLVWTDLRTRRDAESLLLALWVLGTFVFAAILNWSTNGRSILPMVPAVGLLIARRLEPTRAPDEVAARARKRLAYAVLGLAGILAWWIAWSDVQEANGARRAAAIIRERSEGAVGRLFFEGHWGFQYYLEALGGAPLDVNAPLYPGDLLAIPENNTNVGPPQPWMGLLETVEVPTGAVVAVNRSDRGAGFYSDLFGPVPYVFGPVPPDRYRIYEIFDPSVR